MPTNWASPQYDRAMKPDPSDLIQDVQQQSQQRLPWSPPMLRPLEVEGTDKSNNPSEASFVTTSGGPFIPFGPVS